MRGIIIDYIESYWLWLVGFFLYIMLGFRNYKMKKKPTFKDPDLDISIRSKPLTKEEEKEISEFIAKRKKQLQQEAKIASI